MGPLLTALLIKTNCLMKTSWSARLLVIMEMKWKVLIRMFVLKIYHTVSHSTGSFILCEGATIILYTLLEEIY